jgi:hypothetical protein
MWAPALVVVVSWNVAPICITWDHHPPTCDVKLVQDVITAGQASARPQRQQPPGQALLPRRRVGCQAQLQLYGSMHAVLGRGQAVGQQFEAGGKHAGIQHRLAGALPAQARQLLPPPGCLPAQSPLL